ncbi:MAG: Mrp/NBP35 family ATP-binding protein [Deltaproteobacteria bacterium]|nr:Mrp/NBP35 family ATP-binding protein [Deltaproteobacteria bacterium]
MKNIIAVASGKGGVGKSTVSANLAVWLAQYGAEINAGQSLQVALVDVDFCGPSIPVIMGGGSILSDKDNKIIPASKYGVKYISIAFFLQNNDDPIIWRGPRFGKAMEQLFNDISWGEIDICIVDLPPGTGDAQLSLAQVVQLAGAVMVTTPQEVAVSDVRRAVNMFAKVNVPILGVVENMAGLTLPNGEILHLFGQGGGQALCDQYQLKMLGSIPLDMKVREGGDKGMPIVLDKDSAVCQAYDGIAKGLWAQLATSQENVAPIIEN